MGQYYHLVNEDKQEYVVPPMLKMWEIMNNPTAGALAYLTADAPYDGGGTPTAYYERYKDENGEVDWDLYAEMSEVVWPNFGRWGGDRIRTVGDYAESGLYEESVESDIWDDITDEALPEIRAAEEDTLGREGIRIGYFGSYGDRIEYKVWISQENPTKFYGTLHPDSQNGRVETGIQDTPLEAKEAAREMHEKSKVKA